MQQNQRWAVAGSLIAAVLAVSACSAANANGGGMATGTQSANVSTTMTPTAMAAPASMTGHSKGGLMRTEHTMAGTLLANPHGMTVYYYSVDKKGSGVSDCTGACAAEWPPVIAPVRIPAGIKLPGKVGFIVRAGGVHQVTIDGYPVYRYAGDHAPGQANGNGIGGVWHVFTIASSMSSMSSKAPAMPATPAMAASSPSSGGGGGGW
jgi:predicted lipoprotein with Yx(FWY)xxD motif